MGRTKVLWACEWFGMACCVLVCGQAAGQDLGRRERPLCPPEAGERCRQGDYTVDEYFYTVNGHQHRLNFAAWDYFKATCEAAALGDPALPAFPYPKRFRRVTLSGCAPPDNSSYADALRRLNVTVVERLSLVRLPVGTRLSSATFYGLPQLDSLELEAAPGAGVLLPEAGFLSAFEDLRSLVLNGVRPDRLPPRLDALRLRHTGIETLPQEALGVITLEVIEDQLKSVSGLAPRLKTLTLSAPVDAPPTAPALEKAAVTQWAKTKPGPWTDCANLKALYITQAAATELPEGFVSACGALETLELQLLSVRALPPGFLRGAARLRSFKAAYCGLADLPADLFYYSTKLHDIDLSNNKLKTLPRDIFSGLVGPLEVLSLSHNQLSAVEVEGAVGPLSSLLELKLDNNPLGDLCPESDKFVTGSVSVLSSLRSLTQLVLSRCRLTRVCADWTRDMQVLRRLDLTHNSVSRLPCRSLSLRRAVPAADLDLSHNPLGAVDCDERDYSQALGTSVAAQEGKIVISSGLTCDCGAYWLARILRERRVAVQFEPRCHTGNRTHHGKSISHMPLRTVPLEALTCDLPPELCAANCTCVYSYGAGAGVAGGEAAGVIANCTGLDALPNALALPLRRLSARGGLDALRLERLPETLQELDLDSNFISNVSSATAAALFSSGARVRLTRNPLRCACDNAPLLDAINANRHLIIAYENMTCSDSKPYDASVRALSCSTGRGYALGAVVAVALAALAAVAAAALVARPETRLRLKALLHARGYWLARRLEPADVDRPFDAYVSHAEADQRFVVERLLPRLGPRRLCLACRDWPVGAWIPTQIEASVRHSRRTLAIVSKNTMASVWARAELRAAHASALREQTPRLIVVLVDITLADLDSELRALVEAHRTLRWGEPCFWPKLLYALPDPRPIEPAPAPAPPAAA